jgi:hypothetical protein
MNKTFFSVIFFLALFYVASQGFAPVKNCEKCDILKCNRKCRNQGQKFCQCNVNVLGTNQAANCFCGDIGLDCPTIYF